MDNAEVGYWLIIGTLAFATWRISRPLYAVYLEGGAKWFVTFLFFPFIAYFKFTRALREARSEWTEEVIERHNKSRKTNANS